MEERCCGSFESVEFFPICSPAMLCSAVLYSAVLCVQCCALLCCTLLCCALLCVLGNKDCILALAWRSLPIKSPGKALNSLLGARVGPHDSQDRVGRRQAQVIHTKSNDLPCLQKE